MSLDTKALAGQYFTCLINLQVFQKWGTFLPGICTVDFRIIGLLSNSTILARPRSPSPDACFLSGRRKAACTLLPATNLIPAKVILPRRLGDEESA